MARLDTYR